MSGVFNPQWDRMMEIDARLMRRMRRDNFHPSHTGGGCMAWERITNDEGYIWITTDASLGEWEDRYMLDWVVGRYNKEGDFFGVYNLTLFQALKLASRLRAPVADEATHVSMLDYREE